MLNRISKDMANELVRGAGRQIAAKGPTAIKKSAKKAAKKAAKHAAKKHSAKHAAKHAAKAAKHATHGASQNLSKSRIGSGELRRAFHHLQRASAVISLLEPGSGGDLKVLLHHGIERYRDASSLGKPEPWRVSLALGLLRAAEHLSMAGLYAARGVHQLNVEAPPADELETLGAAISARAADVDPGGAYGLGLRSTVYELLKRADGAGDDPHLAWELLMGADGICAALESEME
jgi:hypothetical protein